jgi:phospholipid/cholesterol/gamma-HCH transport system substrate-binding protein
MRRGQRRRISTFQAGAIALVATVVVVYLGFTKAIPFRQHFEINAVFQTANNLRPDSPVRIAGVNVGKVVEVRHLRPGNPQAVVKMRIEEKGRPIHSDATLAIRPRIFLEGNFFVELHPGTPSAPLLGDGDTIHAQRTTTPVQLDQVLTSLQADTRRSLQVLLREYATALSGPGGRGFNASIAYWRPAYQSTAVVNEAMLGTEPRDLSRFVARAGEVAQALDRSPEQLKNLIRDFDTTAAAFAREQAALEETVAELPRTLRAAQPALRSLNEAFPPLRRLVVDLRPAVRSSLPALRASQPFVRQARGLVSRPELRGLVSDLRPTVPALARLNAHSIGLFRELRAASSCQNEVILPWTRDTVVDPNFPTRMGDGTTQLRVYQEAVRWLPGLAGESRGGDANGQWFRVLPGNGTNTYNLTGLPAGAGGVFGVTTFPILGASTGKFQRPAIRPGVPCETQQPPNLTSTPAPPPQRVSSTSPAPASRALYNDGLAYFLGRLRQQERRQRWPRPTPAQLRSLRATDLRLDALRARIVAAISGNRRTRETSGRATTTAGGTEPAAAPRGRR